MSAPDEHGRLALIWTFLAPLPLAAAVTFVLALGFPEAYRGWLVPTVAYLGAVGGPVYLLSYRALRARRPDPAVPAILLTIGVLIAYGLVALAAVLWRSLEVRH